MNKLVLTLWIVIALDNISHLINKYVNASSCPVWTFISILSTTVSLTAFFYACVLNHKINKKRDLE